LHKFAFLVLGCLLSASSPLLADLASVHISGLPQETAILAAYDDAKKLEPYASGWSTEWKYDIPKQEVVDRLSRDLALLQVAAISHSDNAELTLLIGMVGRFAYNLDIDKSYDTTMAALKHAVELAPQDIRGPWFRAAFVCSTASPTPGAEEFLAIEANHSKDQLPNGFWEDYMQCMHVVSMPVHVLRAAKYLHNLPASDLELRDFFVRTEKTRFDNVDLDKQYEAKDAWFARPAGTDIEYVSTACGLSVRVHPSWAIEHLFLAKGDCLVSLKLKQNTEDQGKRSAKKNDHYGRISIMVDRQRNQESPEDYLLMKYAPKGYSVEPDSLGLELPWPYQYVKVFRTGKSEKEENEINRIALFFRDEPEFPGLSLEVPESPAVQEGTSEPQFFRPNQLLKRVPGRLYYEVNSNSELKSQDQVMKDFVFVLQNLKVD